MTPKDKAKDLFMDMKYHIPYVHDPTEPSEDKIAKECALIAAKEISDLIENMSWIKNEEYFIKANFWEDVQKEINRL